MRNSPPGTRTRSRTDSAAGPSGLEEVVESAASVFGAVRPPARGVEGLDRLEKGAVIGRPLIRDAGGNRLAALETGVGVEVLAVSAGVERRPALRAGGLMIHLELARGHLMPAFRAAGDDDRLSVDGVAQRADLLPVSEIGRLLVAFRLSTTILGVLVVPIAFLAILHGTLTSSRGNGLKSHPIVEPEKKRKGRPSGGRASCATPKQTLTVPKLGLR